MTIDVVGDLAGRDRGGAFTFSVPDYQFAGRNATAADVQAYHYDETAGEWEPIPTTYLGDGTFEATTDSFSTFAVGIDDHSAQTTATTTETATPTATPTARTTAVETASPTPTTTEAPTATETAASEQSPVTTTSGTGPGFGVLGAVLALLAVVLAVRFRRR
ncbi:PGF-CTERM sorting domain-containing protein [Haloarculaceae archaeon H-GB2-1]|nr:PGF-CTERM sorting domain-containing protein [Haloarculaceae archaeon H-GB2-1]